MLSYVLCKNLNLVIRGIPNPSSCTSSCTLYINDSLASGGGGLKWVQKCSLYADITLTYVYLSAAEKSV